MRRASLLVLLAFACLAALAAERHAEPIVKQILENVKRIKAADPTATPMAFWDFDGTIIKGDVSEGYEEDGVQKFKGLLEETIKAGLSTTYPAQGGWEQ